MAHCTLPVLIFGISHGPVITSMPMTKILAPIIISGTALISSTSPKKVCSYVLSLQKIVFTLLDIKISIPVGDSVMFHDPH